MALVFPLAIGALFGNRIFSNKTTEAAAKATETQKFSIIVKDDSSLIQPAVVTAVGGNFVTDKTAAIDKVARGEVDAFFNYPPPSQKRPSRHTVAMSACSTTAAIVPSHD